MRLFLPLTLVLAVGCTEKPSDASSTSVSSAETTTSSVTTDVSPTPPTTWVTEAPGATTPDEPACEVTADRVFCVRQTVAFDVGLLTREVHYQVPVGEAPAGGWPVALMFQGSFFTAEYNWDATTSDPFGAYYQAMTTSLLLDAGFAVITPETKLDGSTFWDTNVPPYNFFWESSDDHELMLTIFEEAFAGTFGPVKLVDWYATGISSGGYMTSRMALEYADRFAALAVHSGSYATCSGPLCLVGSIPSDHPPTLLLHGDDDLIVPMSTMESYQEALDDAGIEHDVVIAPGVGHAWFASSPDEVVGWFLTH